jgi:hypothetical protein
MVVGSADNTSVGFPALHSEESRGQNLFKIDQILRKVQSKDPTTGQGPLQQTVSP